MAKAAKRRGRRKEHVLLAPLERARLREWGGTGWLSAVRRRPARRRAMRTVEKLVVAQTAAGSPYPEDPIVLAELLGVSLRHDGSVVDYFHKRGAADLSTDEEWNEFFRLFALAHLEQWLDAHGSPAVTDPPAIVVDEEYLAAMQDLLALARQEGERSQAEAQKEERASTYNMPDVSDLITETRERLQSYLEESDLFAHDAPDGEIPEDEQEREIETAALSRIKLEDLEELAADKKVPLVASKEELAEMIVRRTGVTREEIAELALRGSDLSLDTGLVTRLFPLKEKPSIAVASARVTKAEGKYLRLRLARWFLYDDVAVASSAIVLRGRIRSYQTKPVLEVDGHRLNATPHQARMIVRLRRGRQWAEVDGRQLSDARDMSPVMARGAGVIFNPVLSLPVPALVGELGKWSRQTVWMLSFLQNYLERDGATIHNYSMAHFEAADARAPVQPDEPRIAEIQLKGQHVGDSRDACQRIVDGGRLLAVEIVLAYRPNAGGDSYLIPARIGVDPSSATVQTAAGKKVPADASSSLHRGLIERVRAALDNDVVPGTLTELVTNTVNRAQSTHPVAHATMFAPAVSASSGLVPAPPGR